MGNFDQLVLGMAICRLVAGSIELTGALLMLVFNRVETAFRINALLGLAGPIIFMTVTVLGLSGLVGNIAPSRLFLIIAGVCLILLATR
ncbi:MAG: YqhV family protein [bacterium]|jgi:hypothetical protein